MIKPEAPLRPSREVQCPACAAEIALLDPPARFCPGCGQSMELHPSRVGMTSWSARRRRRNWSAALLRLAKAFKPVFVYERRPHDPAVRRPHDPAVVPAALIGLAIAVPVGLMMAPVAGKGGGPVVMASFFGVWILSAWSLLKLGTKAVAAAFLLLVLITVVASTYLYSHPETVRSVRGEPPVQVLARFPKDAAGRLTGLTVANLSDRPLLAVKVHLSQSIYGGASQLTHQIEVGTLGPHETRELVGPQLIPPIGGASWDSSAKVELHAAGFRGAAEFDVREVRTE